MALTRDERERFLAEPHIATVGVADGPRRGPLLVPVWYSYQPGGRPWFMTNADSRKAKLIAEAGRFSILVERTEPTVRYVSVEGAVAGIEPVGGGAHRLIAERYLAGDALERYVAWAEGTLGEQVVITMEPEHWLSADLGSGA